MLFNRVRKFSVVGYSRFLRLAIFNMLTKLWRRRGRNFMRIKLEICLWWIKLRRFCCGNLAAYNLYDTLTQKKQLLGQLSDRLWQQHRLTWAKGSSVLRCVNCLESLCRIYVVQGSPIFMYSLVHFLVICFFGYIPWETSALILFLLIFADSPCVNDSKLQI